MEPPVDICPTAHASSSSDPIVSSSDPMDTPFVAEPRQVSRRMNLTDDLAFMHVAREKSIQARSEEDPAWRCTRRVRSMENGVLNLVASFVVALSQLVNREVDYYLPCALSRGC